MTGLPKAFIDGYRHWRNGTLPEDRGRLAQLAQLGQSPRAMIVACCDSRVSPETVFSAGLGELFVLRNVASVIPPYRPDGHHHGTSAAIEFALLGLAVPHIIIMGHSLCGGIKAYLNASFDPDSRGEFIGPWMDLIQGAKEQALENDADLEGRSLAQAVEEAAVRMSIANLRTFPEVARREKNGTLTVSGAHLDIGNGDLRMLNSKTGVFTPAW